MKAIARVIHPGTYSSIQSLEINNAAFYGQGFGGVMLSDELRSLHKLLQNSYNTGVIECFKSGIHIEILDDLMIAFGGASADWYLNGLTTQDKVMSLKKGDILEGKRIDSYEIAYLGFEGGLVKRKGETIPLKRGDLIFKDPNIKKTRTQGQKDIIPESIILNSGPDAYILENEKAFWNQSFSKTSNYNRQGFIVEGAKPIHVQNNSFESVPCFPGIVQLTPSGNIIVLGPDCGVTGGYPRIGYLDTISLLAFIKTPVGKAFSFAHRAFKNPL